MLTSNLTADDPEVFVEAVKVTQLQTWVNLCLYCVTRQLQRQLSKPRMFCSGASHASAQSSSMGTPLALLPAPRVCASCTKLESSGNLCYFLRR